MKYRITLRIIDLVSITSFLLFNIAIVLSLIDLGRNIEHGSGIELGEIIIDYDMFPVPFCAIWLLLRYYLYLRKIRADTSVSVINYKILGVCILYAVFMVLAFLFASFISHA